LYRDDAALALAVKGAGWVGEAEGICAQKKAIRGEDLI
jgi:hypothetical protein